MRDEVKRSEETRDGPSRAVATVTRLLSGSCLVRPLPVRAYRASISAQQCFPSEQVSKTGESWTRGAVPVMHHSLTGTRLGAMQYQALPP